MYSEGGSESVSERNAGRETLGFVVFGVGLFLLLSLVSYNIADLSPSPIRPGTHHNLGGPAGAWVAHQILSTIGIVSALWAGALTLWGLLLAFGFVLWPMPRRIVACVLLSLVLAAWAHLELPESLPLHVPAGYGGSIGSGIGLALLHTVGEGGAILLLALAALASLVLTGNLSVSDAPRLTEYGLYYARRYWSYQSRPRAAESSAEDDEEVAAGPARPAPRKGRKKTVAPQAIESLDFSSAVPRHTMPAYDLFRRAEPVTRDEEDFSELSDRLEAQLHHFKVEGKITSLTEGPVVTTLEFEPAPGTKVAKIVALADDLARLLQAKSLRVLAPIPGKNTVGFEVPNQERRVICFGDLVQHARFRSNELRLPIVMGVDTFGKPIVEDLAEMPHLLIAGTTGSGKSVFINTLIGSLICKTTAKELRLVMVDPKMIELAAYSDLPHLACPVITDVKKQGTLVLDSLVHEMETRYRRMGSIGARNIQAFNQTIRSHRKTEFPEHEGKWETLPYIVLLIDEFADLMLVIGKEAEGSITRLAQKARSAGIHLVVATQRPSANVVTGLIKANFSTRVAFRVLSGIDSRTILDQVGAETLLGKGDLLFQSVTGLQRLHAAFLEDEEVNAMVQACT